MDQKDRIYVAGHQGLIGSAFYRKFQSENYPNLLVRTRAELDLTDPLRTRNFFEEFRPTVVILAAGRVGGILANTQYPAEFITQNLKIQVNVIEAAYAVGVKQLMFFASSCMYPRVCPQPMNEGQLLSGHLEPTSLPYAAAKLAGVQMCLAYNQQFKTNFIPVIPNNAYGPLDDFDPRTSHVMSALIRRFHEAKEQNLPAVTLWGTGTPKREFIYSDDIADAGFFLLQREIENKNLPVNIGVGEDHAIREVAQVIARVVGYTGQIEYDTSKPDGAPQKLLDSARIQSMGWRSKTDLEEGIRKTYQWFTKHGELE